MGLILRTTLTPNPGNTLTVKGAALTYAEGDGNFLYLLTNMSGSNISITGSTGIVGNLNVSGTFTLTGLTNSNGPNVIMYNTSTGQFFYQGTGSLTVGTASYVSSSNVYGPYGLDSIKSASYASGSTSASYSLTASYALNSGGGGATLQTALKPNQTAGAITPSTAEFAVGTSLETILRTMLVSYIAPTIGTFSLKEGATPVLSANAVVEVSSSYTFNTASFTAAADNPNGRFAYSASFTASGATVGDFNYYFGNNVLGTSNNLGLGGSQTINRTLSGSITMSLNAINPETSATISQTRTINYVHPIYYGMSASDLSAATTLQGVSGITTLVEAKGTKTVTFNGTNAFFYIAYPITYGNLATIVDLSTNFDYINSVTRYTVTMNNSPRWSSIQYYIYKKNTTTTISSTSFRFTFA